MPLITEKELKRLVFYDGQPPWLWWLSKLLILVAGFAIGYFMSQSLLAGE